ncbi:MAG: hypothetical protein K2X43_00695 [Hyphomonadaceae bacterium]|nr:hypothetical protein [Hyphomonadaceae bacterium]
MAEIEHRPGFHSLWPTLLDLYRLSGISDFNTAASRRMRQGHRRRFLCRQGPCRIVKELEALIDRIISHGNANTAIIQSSPVSRRLPSVVAHD